MYETFAHTADVGLRARASDVNTLFAEAARGLFSLVVMDLSAVEARTGIELRLSGRDLNYLFADWLRELLYVFESRRLLLCEFDVTVDGRGLFAVARGEPFDERRHVLDHEVKAVTYHGLKLEQSGGEWLAEVILDV